MKAHPKPSYNGYTLEQLDQIVASSEELGHGVDCLIGDESAGARIIKDLILEIRRLQAIILGPYTEDTHD
jgi:hypothetical protein